MINRRVSKLLAGLSLVALAAGTAQADDEYDRVSLTINAPYLLVPVYVVNAEVALRPNWSVALRGGAGESNFVGEHATIVELGGQGVYYVTGNAGRGIQAGLDTRYAYYENDGMLSGLGDGVAVGPFIGYKRVFGPGVTLGAQIGAQVPLSGRSSDPVLPYLNLGLGVSFWSVGGAPAGDGSVAAVATSSEPGETAPGDADPPDLRGPLDYHDRFMIGFSLGGGAVTTENCDECEIDAGLAVDGSIGWFLGRRFALMYDTTGSIGLNFSRFGSAGVTLQCLALQYWPHEDWWLKVGVGAARLISVSAFEGPVNKNGGGGTLAAGYEFHHDGNFNMDLQLRAVHGSFDHEDGNEVGVNTFTGLVGINWY